MLYKRHFDTATKTHYIVELKSDQTIKDGMNEKEAKVMCRHLNLGGGFDGNTPDFFFNRITITKE